MAHDSCNKKKHPWRPCPIGEHYVKTHMVTYPPSAAHPNGLQAPRIAHCAKNPVKTSGTPSKKDVLSFSDIEYMTAHAFPMFATQHKLSPLNVVPRFANSEKYDLLILGWVQYWNEVLKPKDPLDPHLIKALMATESSFNSTPKAANAGQKEGSARGLLQVTDLTLKILANLDGELNDNLIQLTTKDLMEPSANICAGVRWIFRKKQLARITLKVKREATWKEAVADYKGYLKDIISGKNSDPEGMKKFREYYDHMKNKK